MSEQILKYWNRPYPPFDDKRKAFFIALAFGVFIFLFLLIFNPFEVTKDIRYPVIYILGFGIITFVVVLTNFFLIMLIPKRIIDRKNWQLKHTFIASLFNIITISAANYLFMNIVVETEPAGIWKSLFYTVAIGIFPVSMILVYSEHQLSKENKKTALKAAGLIEDRKKTVTDKKDNTSIIKITAKVQADSFPVKPGNLLLVKAEGNYSTFFIKNGNGYSKKIARIPLKNVESQLTGYSGFIKCHRSYIINLENVTGAEGNARSVILCIDNMQLKVPVSRAREKAVLSAIGNK